MSLRTRSGERLFAKGFRIRDSIENVVVAMRTAQFAGRLRARPLAARPDHEASIVTLAPAGPKSRKSGSDARSRLGRWNHIIVATSRFRGPKTSCPGRT
jgi:hypothetical protein